jgi:hypothetical protein
VRGSKRRFGRNTECRQPCKSGEMVCLAVLIATAALWSFVAPYQSGVRFIVAFKVHSESLFGLLAMTTYSVRCLWRVAQEAMSHQLMAGTLDRAQRHQRSSPEARFVVSLYT